MPSPHNNSHLPICAKSQADPLVMHGERSALGPPDRMRGKGNIFGKFGFQRLLLRRRAQVMSLDGFSAFQELGMQNEAAIEEEGLRYRNTILAMGGGRAPLLVFRVCPHDEPLSMTDYRCWGSAWHLCCLYSMLMKTHFVTLSHVHLPASFRLPGVANFLVLCPVSRRCRKYVGVILRTRFLQLVAACIGFKNQIHWEQGTRSRMQSGGQILWPLLLSGLVCTFAVHSM
jgi:hypothetical protein